MELKDILLSENPIYSLSDTKWLSENFPELLALDSDDKGHKNNLIHTIKVLNNIMKETNDIKLYYVALFHDLGKAVVKKYNNGWEFHGHELASTKMLPKLFKRYRIPKKDQAFIRNIVKHHGDCRGAFSNKATDSAVKRLYRNLIQDIDNEEERKYVVESYALFVSCDATTSDKSLIRKIKESSEFFLERLHKILAEENKINKKYSINGHDIIKEFNISGEKIGKILKFVKEKVDSNEIPDDRDMLLSLIRKTFLL